MRRVYLLGMLLTLAACTAPLPTVETVRPTATPLPAGFTLLPPFFPAHACALQNVDVYSTELCRSESVKERVLAEGDGVQFILHEYHLGSGCWGSISADTRELRACDVTSGAVTTLGRQVISGLVPSPDGAWHAFATMELYRQSADDGGSFRTHVYKVQNDGSGLQQLDTQGFPPQRFSAQNLRWSADGTWVELELWDGTADGWHGYRLRADGSGVVEALP